MADLHHRLDRFCVRHLRTADAAADLAAGADRNSAAFSPGTPEFTTWFSLLFYVPAVAGGMFGLLGGYLTDRLGRRRVLTWSILLYAFAAFAAGYSTSLHDAALLPLLSVHRRLRRVRRRRGVVGRVVRESAPAREGARLHAGVFVDRRIARGRRQRLGDRPWAASIVRLQLPAIPASVAGDSCSCSRHRERSRTPRGATR